MPRTAISKLVPFFDLGRLAQQLHSEGKRIVTTNGCFDLLHWGHLQYLAEARSLGDVLICGVNSDASVRKLKGPTRPLNQEQVRALQLAALEAVDYVAVFEEETPVHFLQQIMPAIHAKGGDYQGKDLPERATVEAGGGRVVCLKLAPGFSTTELIRKLQE